jgi:hypothetical protein
LAAPSSVARSFVVPAYRRSSRVKREIIAQRDTLVVADQSTWRIRLSAGVVRNAAMGAVAVALTSPWFAALIAGLVATVLVGVVLPGVWSTKLPRRRAALAVLTELRHWLRNDQ